MLVTDAVNATAGVKDSGEQRTLDMDAVAEGAKGAVGAELCGKPFRWDQRLFTIVVGEGRGGSDGGVGDGGLGRATSTTEAALKVS